MVAIGITITIEEPNRCRSVMTTRSVRDTASREESLNNRPRTASAQMLSERPEIVHAAFYIGLRAEGTGGGRQIRAIPPVEIGDSARSAESPMCASSTETMHAWLGTESIDCEHYQQTAFHVASVGFQPLA